MVSVYIIKGIEKNALAVSVVANYLVALDPSLYWSPNMSGTAALSGGIILFRPQYCTVNLHPALVS